MLCSIHFYIPGMYLKKWQMPAGVLTKRPARKNLRILYLPGKWLPFTIKMPMTEKNAYLRYILPIWIIHIRFDLTRPEARFLQMEAFLQLLASIHLFLYGQLFLVEKLVAQKHWENRCIRYPAISP